MNRDQPSVPDRPRLHAERLPPGRNVTERWASWRVLTPDGDPVGVVHEWHDFDGAQHLPATYEVAHNPTGGAGEALWHSSGHPTVPDALAALTAHLAEEQPPTT